MTDEQSPDDAAQRRAEEIVDQVTQVATEYAFRALHFVVTGVARAREEAEDIWAEAQESSRAE